MWNNANNRAHFKCHCADVQQNKAGNPWQPTTYWASFSLDKIYFEILTYKSTLSIYQYKLSNNMKTIE